VLSTDDERRLLEAAEGLVPVRASSVEDAASGDSGGLGAIIALAVTLEDLQDVQGQMQQLSFLPREGGAEADDALRKVQRYLAARGAAYCLQRPVLAHPEAPLPEWRVGWVGIDEGQRTGATDDGRRTTDGEWPTADTEYQRWKTR
jgi:hypothetical protein